MKKSIRTVFVVLVLGAVCVFFYQSWQKRELAKRAEIERKKAEQMKEEQALFAKIDELVVRTNAIDDWRDNLSEQKKLGLEKIFTFELERLWISERPVLFFGEIEDISISDNSFYTVVIEVNRISLYPKIRLAIKCPRQKIDFFIENNPELREKYSFKNEIALVAKMKSVTTADKVVLAEGDCGDILYLGKKASYTLKP